MSAAEIVWNSNAENGVMALVDRWNYHNELGIQFPIAPIRVAYAASGTLPAACVSSDPDAVIEHGLYWCNVSSGEEGNYLISVLNSETARARVSALQPRGQWGARHFDKVLFTLPIPRFNEKLKLHRDLATAADEAEKVAARTVLPQNVKFQRARKLVREALSEAKIAQRIDGLVTRLLDKA
jgi:hypothetical protein